MIGQAVHGMLAAQAAIIAMVPAARIFLDSSPDNIYPIIVYTAEDTTVNNLRTVKRTKRWQLSVTSLAKDSASASAIALAVRNSINTIRGISVSGTRIQYCCFQGAESFESIAPDNPSVRIFNVQQTYTLFTFKEN